MGMGLGLGYAAGGAAQALQQVQQDQLQQLLAQRKYEMEIAQQQQQAQEAQSLAQYRDQTLGLQQDQLEEGKRRQGVVEAEQARQRSDASNDKGISQMVFEGVRLGTTTPKVGRLMLGQHGLLDPEEALRDPDAERQQELADFEEQEKIRARHRPQPQGGASTPQQEWVIRGGTLTPIPRGTAQPGDTPYDAVAARSAQPVNTSEAVDTAREVQRLAGSLAGHKGFGGTFGKWSSQTPQLLASQDTIDSRTLLNSLKGLLTIENMGKMKGVLSDADMRILQQASTTLAAEMSEPAARQELNRLGRVMSKLTGEPWQDIGGVPQNTGAGSGRASGAGPAGGGATEYNWVDGQLVPVGQ